MAAFTDFAENKLIDWLFRGQALGITGASAGAGSGPTTLYIGLLTAPTTGPTDASTFTELTIGTNSYARVAVTSNTTNWDNTQNANTTAASSGSTGTTRNSTIIPFPTPTTAGWGTVYGVGIYDAATGGNLLIYSLLTASKVINLGDSVTFPVNSLTFQIDN